MADKQPGPPERAEQLLEEARAGSTEALGAVLTRCERLLFYHARRLNRRRPWLPADSDLVQETFLRAVSHFDQFWGRNADDLEGWLLGILNHYFADALRASRARGLNNVQSLDEGQASGFLPDALPSAVEAVTQREAEEALRLAVNRFPPVYRQVIGLHYDAGLTFREIGRRLACTENAARKLFDRAMEQLRQGAGPPSPQARVG